MKKADHIPPPLKEEGVRGWTSTRRELRNNATFAEQLLWRRLRMSQLDGRKFTRQKGIAGYVVDFYCPEERLAIELDGDVHDLPEVQEYDVKREAELLATGIKILRFPNNEVVERPDDVLAAIWSVWKGRERDVVPERGARSRTTRAGRSGNSTPPAPSSFRGGGVGKEEGE